KQVPPSTFKNQHVIVKMSDDKCDSVIKFRKIKYKNGCKKINTFILGSVKTVTAICKPKGQNTYSGKIVSQKKFKIIVCKLTKNSPKYPKCQYEGHSFTKKIAITCKKGLPVHYDRDVDDREE
uniref:Ribonuclease A-domain domain-containing protein n=1 Tax=Sphaeramia orbicularis TaxID=375764 RepID=A0A672ZNJ7_9TELE